MYYLQNISLAFNDHQVLQDINLHLSPGEVTALIGKNGSGKTTLLEIAAGNLQPDSGRVVGEHERIGYLPQELKEDCSIGDFFAGSSDRQIHEALVMVGLSDLDMVQSVQSLSGGQKTKVGLARVLLVAPTVLLLDEPTNNLDSEGLEWLTTFIEGFSGVILLTSHDRAFLDAISSRTAELKEGNLELYGGNYTFTRDQQKREREGYAARYEAQEEYRRRLTEDIATTKAQALGVETTTKQVNIRRYAKKVARKATVREARLQREMVSTEWLDKPENEDSLYLPLPDTEIPAGKMVVELRNIHKSLGGREIIHDVSLQLLGGQRIWLSGSNGSGKSTLLKLVLGELETDTGLVKIGVNIRVGSLSQAVDSFVVGKTARDELFSTGEHPTRCFQYARALGLTVADLSKGISDLSRGQLVKLSFAKVLLKSPQLLVLDEPTNHIELEAREAVESALKDFRGAIIVASHDRYFIQSLGIDSELKLGSP